MKVMNVALWIAAACLAAWALAWLWQDRLLYFPQHASAAAMTGGGLAPWPSMQDFRGLVAEPAGAARGTAIVFHGNAGHAGHRAHYAHALVPLGFRVILAEYPGYGPRAGTPGEASFVHDATETVAAAHGQFGAPLLLVGESLGSAVAAGAAAAQREITAGLLLITPWDRLAHVGAHHYPWLPVRWLLRDPYDTVAALATFDRPVVVVLAAQDRIVPARFGLALHAALGGPKHLLQIADAGHNDWPDHVDAAWWRMAMALFDRGGARTAPP